ncbi:hypothetical protein LIER_33287 [Lithospermum erythrorhizon]|uniref:Uncharacterized protein n=1 Tax=Lithospermum erythrorhizon TaxID=34254 RepID=A0AAV3RYG9_LITER
MHLTQQKYAWDIIIDLKMEDAKPVSIPMAVDWTPNDPNSSLLADSSCFRRLIGRLSYMNFSRSDLTYDVHCLR